jgi:hypothetical protein
MTYEGNFDVVIEGVGAEKGARVMAAQEGIYVNQHQIPYSTLLGVALRGSILLVVGTQVAMALRGEREGLAMLAAELRGRARLEHLALADRESLKGERVVFATPVAMSGVVEMERFKGLSLAIVTDQALHVFERGGRHFRIAWDRMTKVDVAKAKFGRLLRIGSGATQLEFLYLTDAQIQTMRGMASRHSSALLGVTSEEGGEAPVRPEAPAVSEAPAGRPQAVPLEQIVELDLTRRYAIPEFEASLGAIGSGSDRPLGAAIDKIQMSSVLPVGFLEEHLRELRHAYDGALLKAKREAATAADVFAAGEALDGRRLWAEVQSSVDVMTEATVRAFERQTRRVAANRRIPWRKAERKHMPSAKEVAGLKRRMARGVSGMESTLKAVSEASNQLQPSYKAGRQELQEAYDRWQQSLRDLDQAYASGWTELSREAVNIWQDALLPRLSKLGGERRRFLPRPIKVALYFIVALFVLFVLYILLTGQLGDVIQFV